MKRVGLLLLGAILALVAATAGTQALLAAVQSEEGDTFYACQTDGKLIPGTLTVDQPRVCRGRATLVSWNEEGSAGPQGLQGPAGPPGLSGYVRVMVSTEFNGLNFKSATASCPPGTRVLGGGAIIGSPPGGHQIGVFIGDSFPVPGGEAWAVGASESVENGATWGLNVYAICAQVAA